MESRPARMSETITAVSSVPLLEREELLIVTEPSSFLEVSLNTYLDKVCQVSGPPEAIYPGFWLKSEDSWPEEWLWMLTTWLGCAKVYASSSLISYTCSELRLVRKGQKPGISLPEPSSGNPSNNEAENTESHHGRMST